MLQIIMNDLDAGGETIGATTVLRVDGGEIRHFEMSANGSGITATPTVDFAALVRALGATAKPSTPVSRRMPKAPQLTATAASTEAAPAPPVKRTRAPKVTTPDGEPKTPRLYRRRPDVEEFAPIFTQCEGSQKGIAAHYGVPEHTANGWLRTFRKEHPGRFQ